MPELSRSGAEEPVPFTLSPVRVGVALLSGALATGIFHAVQQATGTSAIAAALGVPEPAAAPGKEGQHARSAVAGSAGTVPAAAKGPGSGGTVTAAGKVSGSGRTVRGAVKVARSGGTAPHALAVARMPRRIVFRHTKPGAIVLTLQADQLDVEFKEGR